MITADLVIRSGLVVSLDSVIEASVAIKDGRIIAVGDDAIRSMAEACLQGKRKSDIVGRVGGEEFAVLLPETSLTRARIVGERIRKGIAAKP